MKILLVNDDGVYAPGINSLKEALNNTGKHQVYTVAPLEERSTTGHTLTLDSTLRVQQIDEFTYGCSGYPADCTLIGIGHILKEVKPDLVLSGINRGANLAQDIYYSGTCAAAREASFHGFPSIAVSTVLNLSSVPEKVYFESAAEYICRFIETEMPFQLDPLTMFNINVPNVPFDQLKGDQITFLGRRMYSEKIDRRTDFRGNYYYWLVGEFHGNEEIEGSDCHTCDNGRVSISPLDLLNRYDGLTSKWKKEFKSLL